MRQKSRKPQQKPTVHKDMARDELARQYSPDACRLLHIKENTFRQFLLDSEIMYVLAGKLTPYAQHIDAGRFTVKTGENQVNGHAFTQNKFTPKGIQWIAGLWAAHQIQEKAA